jgi:hypothetical protein
MGTRIGGQRSAKSRMNEVPSVARAGPHGQSSHGAIDQSPRQANRRSRVNQNLRLGLTFQEKARLSVADDPNPRFHHDKGAGRVSKTTVSFDRAG